MKNTISMLKKGLTFGLLLITGWFGAEAFGQGVAINTDGSAAHPSAMLDVKSTTRGLLIPRMTSVQRTAIAAPAEGLLVFDTDTDSFWYYDATATAWVGLGGGTNTLDQAYDQGGAGAGRTIDAVDGAVTIAGEDGLLITGTLDSGDTITAAGAGTRMFFNPRKAAFRAGYVTGTGWDDANVGRYSTAMGGNALASGFVSTAMGGNTTASGDYSTAMGSNTEASGHNSTAMGYGTTASGLSSTAMGDRTTASAFISTAMGWNTEASGQRSTAMGEITTASGQTSTAMGLETTASGQFSTAMGDSTVASGHTSTAMGRNATASGLASTAMGNRTTASSHSSTAMGRYTTASGPASTAMGVHNTAPSYGETVLGLYATNYTASSTNTDRIFTVGNGTSTTARSNALTIFKNGTVRVDGLASGTSRILLANTNGDLTPIADGTAGQVLSTNGAGTYSWTSAASGTNTLDQAYDQGGAGAGRTIDAVDGAVTIAGEDGLLITGTLNSGDTITAAGTGTRMFFNPRKAAFRAGYVTGTGWDDANVGQYSTAMGVNALASGELSTAMGGITTASGYASTAMGFMTDASGNYSTAMGVGGSAWGGASTAMGEHNIASGGASTAMGVHNTAPSYGETVLGLYATNYTASSTNTDRVFTVGNGTSMGRSNALTIFKNGNSVFGGSVGATAFNVVSDRRFKTNIEDLETPLAKIMQLRGVSYTWKQDEFPTQNFKDGKDFGFIAQEIEEVIPEVVVTDAEGYKRVNYTNLIPFLTAALQEQQTQIEAQQSRIEALESKNAGLKAENNAVKAKLDEVETLKAEMQKLKAILLGEAGEDTKASK